MRKAFTILAIASIALLACQKETALNEDQNKQDAVLSNIPTEIICEIADAPTKTQYAGNTTFGWTQYDRIKMPVVKKDGGGDITACDFYSFRTTSASGSTSATFILSGGSDDLETYNPNPTSAVNTWTNMGYLIYPMSIFEKEHSGDYPIVNLPSSLIYNASNPLNSQMDENGNVIQVGIPVPMIGRKDGETYKFSTAVGFLKSQITDLNSTATKITLSSIANSVSGKFAVSDESATVAKIAVEDATSGNNTVSLTMTSPTTDETFYFPVPVGTFAANDLSLKITEESGEKIIVRTKRIKKALTIARNEVLAIPALAMTYPNSLSIEWNATRSPEMHYTLASGYYLRICVRSDSAQDLSEYVEGMKFTNPKTDNYNLTGATNKTDGTVLTSGGAGKYYLHYMILNTSAELSTMGLTSLDDSRIVEYGTIPFYYIVSDPTTIVGTYYINNDDRYVITIAVSDDGEKGNVILSHYQGSTSYDEDMKTYGNYDALYGRITFNAPNKTVGKDYALGINNSTDDWVIRFETHQKINATGYLKLFKKVEETWTDMSHQFSNPYLLRR